jgi:hypothetical protein
VQARVIAEARTRIKGARRTRDRWVEGTANVCFSRQVPRYQTGKAGEMAEKALQLGGTSASFFFVVVLAPPPALDMTGDLVRVGNG